MGVTINVTDMVDVTSNSKLTYVYCPESRNPVNMSPEASMGISWENMRN